VLYETHETAASQWICRARDRDAGKAKSYQQAGKLERMKSGNKFNMLMMERLVSLLMAFGLGYIVLSSPYVNLEWAVIIAWFLVGAGAMVKIYLYGIAKKRPSSSL